LRLCPDRWSGSESQAQKRRASRMCYLHALVGRSWQPNPQRCH
jgi:hypothetical protein